MVIGTPRSNGSFGNVCAFCHFWAGSANLSRHKISDVTYDERAQGECLERGSVYKSTTLACPKFQISNEASRYCKR